MARGRKHTAEQIVNLLRQVEVGVANGKTLPQACKEAEIVEQTYYRWRKEYGLDVRKSVPPCGGRGIFFLTSPFIEHSHGLDGWIQSFRPYSTRTIATERGL